MPKQKLRWSTEDLNAIQEMRAAGRSWDEIAKHFRVRRETIRRVALEAGLSGSFRWTRSHIFTLQREYEISTVPDLAEKFGCTEDEVTKMAHSMWLDRQSEKSERDLCGESPLPAGHPLSWDGFSGGLEWPTR